MRRKNSTGTVLLIALIVTFILTSLTGFAVVSVSAFGAATARLRLSAQAFELAEAGVDKAIFELARGPSTYEGESETALAMGTFSTSVRTVSKEPPRYVIVSTGRVPAGRRNIQARVEATVELIKTPNGFRAEVLTWNEG